MRGRKLSARQFGVGTKVVRQMPAWRADLAQERSHLVRVGDQLAVQVARIPVKEHATDVEHDSLDARMRHEAKSNTRSSS